MIRLTKKLTEAKNCIIHFMVKLMNIIFPLYGLFHRSTIACFGTKIDRNMKRINAAISPLLEISVSARNLPAEQESLYVRKFIKYLVQHSGEAVHLTKNILDNKQNLDAFAWISASLKMLIADLSKLATDLELLENPKITIPDVDTAGHYVVFDMIKQVSFYIMGNNLTIARSVEAGKLEKNIYLPIIYACYFEMCNMIRRSMRVLRENVIENLKMHIEINPTE